MKPYSTLLVFIATLWAFCTASAREPDAPARPSENAERTAAYAKRHGSAPLLFTENRGQIADEKGRPQPHVLFSAHSDGVKVFMTSTGIIYQLEKVTLPDGFREAMRAKDLKKQAELEKKIVTETHRLSLVLEGANPQPVVRKEKRSDFYENFYLAHCPDGITHVATYEKLVYEEVYPGIDWIVYANGNRLKYEFNVKAGADPSLIKLKVIDADGVSISENGELTIVSSLGSITEHAPVSFCDGASVESSFKQRDDGSIGFELGAWDRASTLTIDPTVDWATYYGTTSSDDGRACVTDASNNVYMTGISSNPPTSLTTGGAHQTLPGGGIDVYVVKFATGGTRTWATYYGGTLNDYSYNIAVDGSSNIFVSGSTPSTTAIGTAGTFQPNFSGGTASDPDAFVVKFNSSGVRQWGTYFGANGTTNGAYAVATDGAGNVYACGSTDAASGLATLHQMNSGGGTRDGFLVKFNGSNGQRLWSTFYGSTGWDDGWGVATDGSNNVYMVGKTSSPTSTAIYTSGAHQTTAGGGQDGFIVKFNSSGTRQWGTYVGGTAQDFFEGVCSDATGNIYIAGGTASNGMASTGAHQTTFAGGLWDAWFLKFNTSGVRQWATYYGGNDVEVGIACDLNSLGEVFFVGYSESSGLAIGGMQNSISGSADGLIAKFSKNGVRRWTSYYGGASQDILEGCATDVNGNVFAAGYTYSSSGVYNSPGFQSTYGGGEESLLVKVIDQGIATGAIAGSPFCAGELISVPYTKLGNFNAGNNFIAQLSNASGSFSAPITLGSIASTTSGSITVTIPAGTPSGTGYRIRVISSSPSVIGEDNGTNLTIDATVVPTVTISASPSTTISSPGTSITFTANPTNGGTVTSYQWRKNGTIVGTNNTTYTDNVWANGDQITVRMTSNANCASPTQVYDTVTVQLLVVGSSCDLTNYSTIPQISPTSYPYTSPSSNVTVSATLIGITTNAGSAGSCGGNTYATSGQAWYINNPSQSITLNFSAPINNFSFIVNGTGTGETFTVTPLAGSISFSNYCSAGFTVSGNSISCTASGMVTGGSLISVGNTVPTTQYTITHNGIAGGSRVMLLDCFPIVLEGPADVDSGIVLWLDGSDVDNNSATANPANNTGVSQWKDVSGNGNNANVHVGQNTPQMGTAQINGKDVVKFTRTSGSLGTVYNIPTLDIRASSKPKLTLFTVYRMGASTLNQGLWGNDNGNWDRFFYPIWSFNATDGAVGVGAPTNIVSIPGSGTIGDTKLLTTVFQNGATDSSVIYYNALPVDTFTDNSDPTAALPSFFVGWDGDNSPLQGDIAEVIAYRRKLTPCEIKAVNRYLGYKYGVSLSTATISPMGSAAFCTGSSVTLTASAGTSYQWMSGTSIIPSATSQTYAANAAGSYRVIVSANGCPDTSAAVVVSQVPNPIFVSSSVSVSGTGATWAAAKKTLTEALAVANAVSCPVQIWVKGGTYYPTTSTGAATTSRDSSFRILRNNIKVYGGFAGTESTLAQRTAAVMAANPTTLSGDIGTPNDSSDNSYHVMTISGTPAANIDTTTIVNGFTITAGHANGSSVPNVSGMFIFQSAGGGINCAGLGAGSNSSPLLENIVFTRNNSIYGGGLYGQGHNSGKSSPTVRNCTFRANRATESGGGMHFYSAGTGGEVSPRFISCTFQYNYGRVLGGAGYAAADSPAICNLSMRACTLDSNYNTDTVATPANYGFYYGGALTLNSKLGTITLDNCSFTDNRSYFSGAIGSISLLNCIVDSCTFSGNKAMFRGGAISLQNAGLTVTNSSFTANTGQTGGAIGVVSASALTVTNCDFTADSATFAGGAIYHGSSLAATVTDSRFVNNWGVVVGAVDKPGNGNLNFTDCIFSGNKTAQLGGVLNNFAGSTSFVSCVLTGNSTTTTANDGGGAVHLDAGSVTFTNSTLSNNTTASTAVPGGNAISADAGTSVNLVNSIVWGAATTQVAGAGTATYSYSNVRGITPPANSLSIDPSFFNAADPDGADNVWATSDDGLRLAPCSPSINAGANPLVPPGITTDITGAIRIQQGNVDMGAYESSTTGSVVYVASTVAVSGNGTSWATAFKTVGEALAFANNTPCVDTIWVKAGTYYPTTNTGASTNDRDSSFRVMRNGIRIYGGFAGTETLISQRNVNANPTILSGDIGTPGLHTDNSYKVITVLAAPGDVIDSSTIIDGFTIKRGNAAMATSTNITRNGQSYARWDGGGILIVGSGATCSPTVQNCRIDSNDATFGTGIYNAAYTPGNISGIVRNCSFTGNNAVGNATTGTGGAYVIYGGAGTIATARITNCQFTDNTSANAGGAAMISGGGSVGMNPVFEYCSFTRNKHTSNAGFQNAGGAIKFNIATGAPVVRHCTFTGNSANYGGAIFSNTGYTLDSSTFTGNTAVAGGGGLAMNNAVTIASNYCTFTNNNATSGAAFELYNSSTFNIANSSSTLDSASFTGGICRINGSATLNATSCRFENDWAAVVGGIDVGIGTLNATDCIFSGNKGTLGGAINNYNGAPNVTTLVNCVFAGNQNYATAGDGGAIHVHTTTTTNIVNCSFNDNTTASTTRPDGNALSVDAGATVNVRNSILWGAASVQVQNSGTTTYQHSDVKGVAPTATNLNLNPFFVNTADPNGADNIWATSDDGLRLTACSPVLNAGNNSLVPGGITQDITGAARIQSTTVDMGAYEHATVFVGYPTVTINNGVPNPACAGANITFTATPTNGGTPSYQWYRNSTAVGTNAATFSSTTLASNDTVWAILTNTACGYKDTGNRVVVTINTAPPTPGAISGATSVCPGVSQTYSITAIPGATSYSWTLPSGWTGTSNTPSINVTTASGSGNITVTATNSCGTSSQSILAVSAGSTPPAPGTISAPASICSGIAQTFSVNPVGGATSYTWTLPVGWTGTSTTNSISATPGATGGTIQVAANTSCGASSPSTLTVSITPAPATPGVISGAASVCSGVSQPYSITPVAGATSYTWTLPTGWTGASTTASITTTPAATGGNITVTATNGCGTSAASVKAVTSGTTPAAPGAITGPVIVCAGAAQNYSIGSIIGATSYTWTLPPGWTGSSSMTSISATPSANSGTVSVTATNSCGTSSAAALAVSAGAAPATPGAITGDNAVCAGASETYSITPVAGATSYTWTLPSGWTGTSTTASITATVGASSGNVQVTANSSCGTSSSSALVVTVTSTPITPGSISGSTSVCPNVAHTYTVTPVAGATSYNWTLPAGWSGTSSTASISATPNTTGGTISVTAENVCGTSSASTLAVNVTTTSTTPGAISGLTTLCAGASQTYSVSPVAGATSYTWTLPAGWTGTSTTNSITAATTSVSGTISVTATNACGQVSTPSTLAVTVGNTPPAPGTISGLATLCSGVSQTYSILPVSGATSYTWSLPTGWTGTSTTTSISATPGATGGTISVTATSSCGTSTASMLAVNVSSAPATPGVISGAGSACAGVTSAYSIAAVPSATSYAWTLPAGWGGSSSSTSISAIPTSAGGMISVTASNACGTSAASSLVVTSGAAPGSIGSVAGADTVCAGTSQAYNVSPVAGATGYTWTLPSGWTGTSTTASISATTGATGGIISVTATTPCGTSAPSSLIVSIRPAPTTPTAITGPANVCPGIGETYSIGTVTGATSYTWTLPAGWTGTSNTTSISATPNSTSGTVSVTANNACGVSTAASLAVNVITTSTAPGAISGPASVCAGVLQSYSVTPVPGAVSYTWTLPTGWTGSSMMDDITVTTATGSGNITVTATNACSQTSTASVLAVTAGSAPPAPGAISGATTVCIGLSETYSITPVGGATSYTWILPTGWTGSSTSSSITVTPNNAGGTISVTANTSCGASSASTLAVNIGSTPAAPGSISGAATACAGSAQTYSVVPISGATSYTWTLPGGWTGTSTSASITATTGATGGTVSVTVTTDCGTSAASNLVVSITPLPAAPNTISGFVSVCPGVVQTYSVGGVSGATSYTWTLPSGWAGTSTTTGISATPNTTGGTISVTANNACGTSAPASLSVNVTTTSPAPGGISGATTVCAGTSQIYSVTPVPGATSYTWTMPTGWTGSSTTNSITAATAASGGTIAVTATNACGQISSASTLAVTVGSAPSAPGTIAGADTVCSGNAQTYSVMPVPGATSYNWSLPSGWTGSSTGSSITTIAGAAGGPVSVTAVNACGASAPSTRNVTLLLPPPMPGSITGSATVCAGVAQTYSVGPVTGATLYTWAMPTGWSGSSTTTSVSATPSAVSGIISVTASNACGTSPASAISVSAGAAPAAPGAITGSASVCAGASETYSIPPVPGATSYVWTLPSGWTGTSSTASITTTVGSSAGTVSVTAMAPCGTSTASSLAVSIISAPATPATISGASSVCPGVAQTYSVVPVSGATSYTWTLPGGWTGTSSTASINATTGSASGTVSVTANNACGVSAAASLAVNVTTTSPPPGAISGATSVCAGVSQTYSVTPVAGAVSYTWTLPSGWTGTSTTASITATTATGSGNITVTATNACGQVSTASTLAVTAGSAPPAPGAITGATTVCTGVLQTYSITPVGGATSYTWALPTGWIGTSVTNTISVTPGATGGTVSVTANTLCGASTASTLAVSIGAAPAAPGSISGATAICAGSAQTYSVTAVPGATSYTWTLPGGWTGTSTAASISATAGTAGGTVSVTVTTPCGTSAASTLAVSITPVPGAPGTIIGSAVVCPNSAQTYSVGAVNGATSFTWTLPAGWSGTSSTASISTTATTTGGTVSVTANNTCGISAPASLAVSVITTAAAPGAISGAASVCAGVSQTYSVTPVSGAVSYTWTLPAGWTGTSTTASINATTAAGSGTISVTATNACGQTSTASILAVTSGSAPPAPGAITGAITVCGGVTQTYSITPVGGATSYTWTVPLGWTGTSTTNSITVTPNNTSGTVSVVANTSCGTSSASSLAVSAGAGPGTPGTIAGPISVCAGVSQTYNIGAVSGATSYTWTLPIGWTGSSTGTSISITPNGSSGNLSVAAVSGCGTSGASTLAIAADTVPAQPGAISGPASVCNTAPQTYTITGVPGATTYTWTLPGGWTGTSTTNSITVTPGATGGNISVTAGNGCGVSLASTLAVSVGTPTSPGPIVGPVVLCPGTMQTYSVAPVAGTIAYNWTLPAGWSGSGSGSIISVVAGTVGGNISVSVLSSCGLSAPSILALTVPSALPQPGAISGATNVCAGVAQTYSITPITGATTYTWMLPAGWTGTSTTSSIIVTPSTTGGTISVTASNACNFTTTASTLTVTSGASPGAPSAISGAASVCAGVVETYGIAAVPGATSYTWTLPGGWTGASGTNSISATPGATGGTISVTATTSCGTSAASTLAVGANATPAQPGSITGPASVCPAATQTYSVTAVPGATSYTWTLPVGWTGSSNTASIATTAGSASGNITVTATNACGTSSASSLAVNSSTTIGTAGPISGPAIVCAGVAQTYSITPVSGATTYTWSLPAGWTGTSTTASITVTPTTSGGTISVIASGTCGTTAPSSLAVTSGTTPGSPGTISGTPAVCAGSTETYSIAPVGSATGYTWALPAGWSGTSSTNSITVTTGTTGGNISVTATTSCGVSAPASLAVSVSSTPAQPGSISGASSVCVGSLQTYSVAPVAGATSYTWTTPAGWTGTSTTSSLTTMVGTSGNISVTASTGCGTSSASTLAVNVSTVPAQPGAITGPAAPCASTTQTYSVPTVSGVTYTWTLPGAGWSGISSTSSINATVGTASGNISVTATNGCGTSTASIMAVAPAPSPGAPGAISGAASPCVNTTQTYSVAVVSGATSYTWTLPPGWSGTSTTNSITATPSAVSGAISVTATTVCGTSVPSTLTVTPVTTPATPGTISGPTTLCSGAAATFSITAVTGATSYVWTTPVGWTGASATTSLTATPNTTAGTVTVAAQNACGISSAASLFVTPASIPAQPGAVTGPTTPCATSTQTYSIPASAGATTYNWILPVGWTGSSTTNSIAVTVGNSSGAISVTAGNGCGTSSASTLSVTPNPVPAQPVAITGSTQPCIGAPTTYSIAAVGGATSYTWTVPAGWAGGTSTTTSVSTTPTAASGNVIVTANNVCGSSAATTLAVTPITIPAQPATMTVPATICQNAAGTYSVPPVPTATSYTWTLPSGWTGSSTSNTIIATPGTTSGIISVTASNACGTSPARTASVTVTPLPGVPSAISGPSPVCAGSIQLYSTGGSAAATTYVWTLPSGWGGSSSASSISTTVTGTSGSIMVRGQNACGISAPVSLAVTVNPATPTSAVIAAVGPTTVCSGVPVTFNATITGTGTTPTYMWTRNGTVQGGATGTTFTVSNPVSGDVIGFSMTSSAVCPLPAVANATPITITVLPPTVPGININTQFSTAPTICAGTQLNFSANIVGGGTTPAYQWRRNGVVVGTNAPTYAAANWVNSETVYATLTSNAQCATPASINSNVVTVAVNPSVTPGISISASPGTSFVPGQPVTFTATIAGGGLSPAVQWIRNSVNILGAFGPIYTTTLLTGGDTITARLTSSDPCATATTALSNALVMVKSTAVTDVSGGGVITLHPNPSDGHFTISVTGGRMGVRTGISVLNALGQVVYFREVITERKDWSAPVDLQDVAAGIYLLRMRGEDGSVATIRFEVKK